MPTIVIKVKTEELRTKADLISGQAALLRKNYERISTLIDQTKNYWVGKSADLKQKEFKDNSEKIQEMLSRIERYPVELIQMAGIYETAEEANKNMAASLDSNVIL